MIEQFGLKDVERSLRELCYEYKQNPHPNDELIGISRRADISLEILKRLIEQTQFLKNNLKEVK